MATTQIHTPGTTTGAPRILNARLRWLARALWALGVLITLAMLALGVGRYLERLPEGRLGIGVVLQGTESVVDIDANAAAYRAGVRNGDVLLAVNGASVAEDGTLPAYTLVLGEPVTLTVRDPQGQVREVTYPASGSRIYEVALLMNTYSLPPALSMGLAFGFELVVLGVFVLLAVLVGWQRNDSVMGLLMSLLLLATGVRFSSFFSALNNTAGWLVSTNLYLIYVLPLAVGLVAFFLLFPDGRLNSRWALPLLAVYTLWEIASAIGAFGLSIVYTLGVLLVYAVVLALLLRRYRTEFTPLQRQQTKWVILGLGLTLTLMFFPVILRQWIFETFGYDVPVLYFIQRMGLLIMPLMLSFALLRYRLYDVDLIVNRGLVYGGLTVLLVLVFGGVVALVTLIARDQQMIAVVLAAVAAGALFNPVRLRLQRLVDRRFFHLRVGLNQLDRRTPHYVSLTDQRLSGAWTGKTIGAFAVQELLGRGGMGEVYRGEHTKIDRSVAIKILPPELARQPEFRARFEREAQTIASLHHPNIVNLYDFGTLDEQGYYMVMEYVAGMELSALIHERGALPLSEALPLLREIATALDYAHSQQVIHRDVKPSNIMLQPVTSGAQPYRAILTDFGIARVMEDVTNPLTQTGMMGTIDYAAPEQILSARTVDGRADQYALAVIAYQMLTGELPFKGSAAQVLFAHLQQPPPDASAVRDDLPAGAVLALRRALSKDPASRYDSAGAFVAALAG